MKKSKSSLVKNLEELIETLENSNELGEKLAQEASSRLVQGAALNIIDLSLPYNHMFSPAAKRGMANKVKSLNPEREIKVITTLQNKVTDRVEYLGALAMGEEKLVKAARIVADHINRYAALGYVTGCLSPLGAIRLATEPHELEKYAVFCFVSLSEAGTAMSEEERSPIRIEPGAVPTVKAT